MFRSLFYLPKMLGILKAVQIGLAIKIRIFQNIIALFAFI